MFSIWQNQPTVALTPQANIADAASCRRSFLPSLLPTGEVTVKQFAGLSLGLAGDHAAHALNTARGVSGDMPRATGLGSYQGQTKPANRHDAVRMPRGIRFVIAG